MKKTFQIFLLFYFILFSYENDNNICSEGSLDTNCIVNQKWDIEDHPICSLIDNFCNISGNGNILFKENGILTMHSYNITIYLNMNGYIHFSKKSGINATFVYLYSNDYIKLEENSYINVTGQIYNNECIYFFS